METEAKEETPYYSIEGDLDDQGSDEVLYIGYVSKVHYQSLLLDDSENTAEMDDSEVSDLEEMENESKIEEKLVDDLDEERDQKLIKFPENKITKTETKSSPKEKEKIEEVPNDFEEEEEQKLIKFKEDTVRNSRSSSKP